MILGTLINVAIQRVPDYPLHFSFISTLPVNSFTPKN